MLALQFRGGRVQEAGAALKPGANTVTMKVTNLWVNRLIGDAQPGAATTVIYTSVPFYQADAKLQPAGLLGSVRVLSAGESVPVSSIR